MPKIKNLTLEQIQSLCEISKCNDCQLMHKNECFKTKKEYNKDWYKEYFEKEVDLEMAVYQKICVGCERERHCHEECESCEEYQTWYNKLWGLTDE